MDQASWIRSIFIYLLKQLVEEYNDLWELLPKQNKQKIANITYSYFRNGYHEVNDTIESTFNGSYFLKLKNSIYFRADNDKIVEKLDQLISYELSFHYIPKLISLWKEILNVQNDKKISLMEKNTEYKKIENDLQRLQYFIESSLKGTNIDDCYASEKVDDYLKHLTILKNRTTIRLDEKKYKISRALHIIEQNEDITGIIINPKQSSEPIEFEYRNEGHAVVPEFYGISRDDFKKEPTKAKYKLYEEIYFSSQDLTWPKSHKELIRIVEDEFGLSVEILSIHPNFKSFDNAYRKFKKS